MRSMEIVDRLVSERWPDLKKRAEQETDHEALIALLGEIDDLLVHLEKRIAAIDKDMGLDAKAGPGRGWRKSVREVHRATPVIRSP
jgi:hypothetical protein